MSRLFTNEIVFRGHPDKVCDQISDAIVDACLSQDKGSRCGVETMGGKSAVYITGEITTRAEIDIEAIALGVLERCGYPSMPIVVDVGRQSADIALGTNDQVGGAGDNGMMFGFATRDTTRLLPKAMVILQEFSRAYDELRKNDPGRFRSDGKAQITGIYDENMWLQDIDTFTICYQNSEKDRKATDKIVKDLALSAMHKHGMKKGLRRFLINPTGRFEIGGFEGDAGMTGRKIVVDSYHGFAPVGGGAFSGKDPTKVDRSGAYMARLIAMDTLTQQSLRWCQVQLSYSIGIEEPMAIYVTSDRGHIDVDPSLFDRCKPANIIEEMRLLEANYERKAAFGHFE